MEWEKNTNLKADDEEVMVISRRFIRSIWEAAAILLAVIIAPLRELFHSPNFNHHPTITSPFHHHLHHNRDHLSNIIQLQLFLTTRIVLNFVCLCSYLLFCFVPRLSHVSAKFARWIERYLWHWWHDTNGWRWRKEIFCLQLKLCEPQWRRIRRTKLTKVQDTNYKMCLFFYLSKSNTRSSGWMASSSSMDCLVCTLAGLMMMAMLMLMMMTMVMVMTMTVMMPEVAMTSSDAQCELKGTGAVVQLD